MWFFSWPWNPRPAKHPVSFQREHGGWSSQPALDLEKAIDRVLERCLWGAAPGVCATRIPYSGCSVPVQLVTPPALPSVYMQENPIPALVRLRKMNPYARELHHQRAQFESIYERMWMAS